MWNVFQMKLGKFTMPAVKRWVLEHWIEQSKYLRDSNRRYSLQWPYRFALVQECNYSCSYLLLNCSNKCIHCHISLYKLLVCFVCFILFVSGLLSETTICMLSITIYPQYYNISSPSTTVLFMYQSEICFSHYSYH